MSRSNKEFNMPEIVADLLEVSGNGLQEIVTHLSNKLGLSIIITDPYYSAITSTFDDDKLEMIVSTHFEGVQNTLLFKCSLDFNSKNRESFGYPIRTRNQNYGFLFLLCDHARHEMIEQYDKLIQYTASLCALHLKHEQELANEKKRYKDAFLFDILYGNIKNKEDIISYGMIWKWDFEEPHMVVVFSLSDYNHYSDDRQLLEAVDYIVEKSLAQNGINPIKIRRQGEIISMIPVNEKTNYHKKKELTDFIQYMLKQTKDTSLEGRVACGIGQVYNNPVNLYRSYQEAKVAFELGLLLKNEFQFFHDLGLERVLYKHDLQDLKEFYQHIVGDLVKYDEDNQSELMETLENFANHQFDLKQTSEAIFLHRNTLRYRIKKIEEILDIKLDDMNNRLNIIAAFKIKLLHKL